MSKKIIVAGMLVFCILFGCAFSYAAFTSTITAGGTVSAKGNFDVYFVKSQSASSSYAANDTIATVESNSGVLIKVNSVADADVTGCYDTLNLAITVPKAFTSNTFKVYVHNASSVTANVDVSNTVKSSKDSSNMFQLSCEPVTLASGETKELIVTLTKVGSPVAGNTYSGIQLKLAYTQPTVASAPTAAHSHS